MKHNAKLAMLAVWWLLLIVLALLMATAAMAAAPDPYVVAWLDCGTGFYATRYPAGATHGSYLFSSGGNLYSGSLVYVSSTSGSSTLKVASWRLLPGTHEYTLRNVVLRGDFGEEAYVLDVRGTCTGWRLHMPIAFYASS